MPGKTEPPGDAGRNAAAIIESFINDDMISRATIMITASHEYHARDHCPMMGVAMILAQELTDLAQATGTSLAPRLARLRAAAEALDEGG